MVLYIEFPGKWVGWSGWVGDFGRSHTVHKRFSSQLGTADTWLCGSREDVVLDKSSWYTLYAQASGQYISSRKLFFVVSQTARAKFHLQMSFTQQKQISNDVRPGFGKLLLVVGGWPLLISTIIIRPGLCLFWSVGYSWPRMGHWLLPSCLSKERKKVGNVCCLHTGRRMAYLLCGEFSVT